MFSDTHFHFQHFTENTEIIGSDALIKMAQRNIFFGLDIGTHSDDLLTRQACIDNAISQIKETNLADKARNFIYFSAGIWPAVEEIQTRDKSLEILKSQIKAAETSNDLDTLHRKIIAIGECGIDHHWNPKGVDGRCESDFTEDIFYGEKALFEMQLELSKQMNLPIIIHSRDAFEDTLDCIKNINYNNGIIHCYSYGLEEAKKFIDLGWYISLSGSVTYTKRSKMEQMKDLINYIPKDRLLCETDSPYLAPVPFRGQTNTPNLIENTYNFISEIRNISSQELSTLVDENIKKLFKL